MDSPGKPETGVLVPAIWLLSVIVQGVTLGAVLVGYSSLRINLTVVPAGAPAAIQASLTQEPPKWRRRRGFEIEIPQDATLSLDARTRLATK